jgi:pyruvate/2-oxoglutarate/acetoin dehydrogenase E1 component
MAEITYVEAVNQAMCEEMRRDPSVFLMGEDVQTGYGGGVFGASKGMLEEFGPERVIDTPLAELAISGAAGGAAYFGMRPIAEIQFADFLGICHDQIQGSMAKYRWASGGGFGCPVVYRGAFGAGVGAGPNHSQSPEAWFGNTPGLTIVMPSTPSDAKGLLKAAIRCDDPVIFLEHKLLYRRLKEEMPEGDHIVPLGKGDIKRAGSDVTVVATAAMVQEALTAAEQLAAEGIELEVIDPRTVMPLDVELITESVNRTGHAVIVHEAPVRGGIGGEIAAVIAEHCQPQLRGPVLRVGAPWTPVPANRHLERTTYLPNADDIVTAIRRTLG